ncbi:MAG: HNH endonuclease [Thermoanaerobaculia bacterium]|nr:HNH endonuclease [Thermoanaerobaculia bacterium]
MSDQQVRLAAFAWLDQQVARHGDVLPWSVLHQGFTYEGVRVPLVSQQGIFKPKVCTLPLSIRTSPGGPYADSFAADGLLQYQYRGTDPNHRENVGLREAMRLSLPLVFLYGHMPGRYHAVWPVFVVGDDPGALTFTVAAHHDRQMTEGAWTAASTQVAERRYATVEVRQRLHQQGFRERVLGAYKDSCAMCRLKHRELLDAAHIIADTDPLGEPVVPNGLALCKLHHAAFDRHIVAVDPDYRIIIRADILEEVDGPMLKHGLQELHGHRIQAPKRADWKPSRDFLAMRMEAFLAGSP